jgi:hypothetical protein
MFFDSLFMFFNDFQCFQVCKLIATKPYELERKSLGQINSFNSVTFLPKWLLNLGLGILLAYCIGQGRLLEFKYGVKNSMTLGHLMIICDIVQLFILLFTCLANS